MRRRRGRKGRRRTFKSRGRRVFGKKRRSTRGLRIGYRM